jgi:CBS domain-containing protein
MGLQKNQTRPAHGAPAFDVYARQPGTVAPDSNPAPVARLMIENNIGHLPVVREGKVIGIVTRTDILNYLYNMLPE